MFEVVLTVRIPVKQNADETTDDMTERVMIDISEALKSNGINADTNVDYVLDEDGIEI